MSNRKGDYDVGYGRPPKQHQFMAGTSGNPKGRPPKSRNAGKVLHDKLFERVTISQNGKRTRMTFMEVIAIQLRKKALEGDARAMDQLIRLLPIMQRSLETEGDSDPAPYVEQEDIRNFQKLMALYGNAAESEAV